MTQSIALLGLDIGTTSCKLICFDAGGSVIAQATAGYEQSYPHPGWAELDPAALLDAVKTVLSGAAAALAPFERLAMAISAQGEAFVLVDAAGRALAPAPVSIDMRGRDAVAAFNLRRETSKATEEAGQELNAQTSLAKLLWFRDAPGRLLERADKVLCTGEFVIRCLGLAPVMDHSMAARTGLLDNVRLRWSETLIGLAGLRSGLFPPVAPSGRAVGTARAASMAKFGLPRDVEVYTGGHDQACAMLGAGVIDPSTAMYSIGTTEAVGLPVSTFRPELKRLHIAPYPHVVAGCYVLLFGSQSGGRALPWLARLRGLDRTDALFEGLPGLPSAVTVLPHLAGSGTVIGDEEARGSIQGLEFATTPEALTLAVLEGITMEQALGLRRLERAGIQVEGIRAVGGGTRSAAWMQIKADILGRSITCLAEPDTACAGAAILAGLGCGIFSSVESAAARLATAGPRYDPRAGFTAVYDKKLALYEQLYATFAGLRPLEREIEQAIARLAVQESRNS